MKIKSSFCDKFFKEQVLKDGHLQEIAEGEISSHRDLLFEKRLRELERKFWCFDLTRVSSAGKAASKDEKLSGPQDTEPTSRTKDKTESAKRPKTTKYQSVRIKPYKSVFSDE